MTDWDLDGPGMQKAPAASTRRAGSSVYQRLYNEWKRCMAATDVVQINAPRSIFNKHVKELLTRSNEESILAAFKRFAGDVRANKVPINKNPWFVFYGRRERYVSSKTKRLDVDVDKWDGYAAPEGAGWDDYKPKDKGW